MAYKVEMFNGKSNQLEIMGQDEDGELYVEKIIVTGEPDPDYRKFSCSAWNWEKALELGKKMGWKPSGSVLEKTLDTAHPVLSDYKPSVWGEDDYKVFVAEDARAFAEALEKAAELMQEFQLQEYGEKSPILLTAGMQERDFNEINRNLSKEFLLEFAFFLRGGKFNFVWDD